MNPILISVTLAIACLSHVRSQPIRINLEVYNPKNKEVSIMLPVEGTYFQGNKSKEVLHSDNTLSFTATLEKAGPIAVHIEEVLVRLFMQPGDQISLKVNPSRKDSVFSIRGSNSAGQYLLNNRPLFYEYEAIHYIGKDSLTTSAISRLKEEKIEQIKVYKKLFDDNKINKPFFDFALLNLDYQNAALQASMGAIKYYSTILPVTHPKYTPHFARENAVQWEKTYQEYELSNQKALATFYYFDYAYDYVRSFLGEYLVSQWGNNQNSTTVLQKRYTLFDKSFKEAKVKEYLLATFIYLEANRKKYQPELVDVFEAFSRQYPQSSYTFYLTPLIEEIVAYNKAKNQLFKADQKLIANYQQIDSFKMLLEQFKGKTIFVDLWATWCSPCIEEFAYGQALKSFVNEKNVEILYVSMDEDKADDKWKNMIRYHNLSGYHIRVNEKLKKELIDTLWSGKGYSIPRYLIVDRMGSIVEMSALKPSTRERLYEQINKYIDK